MFATKLRQLRMKRKISQKELAKAIYVSNSSISHYENNRCKPSRETIEVLAQYFDVSIDYLLDSPHICSIEDTLLMDYYGSLSVYELVNKCLKLRRKDRETLISIINALEAAE